LKEYCLADKLADYFKIYSPVMYNLIFNKKTSRGSVSSGWWLAEMILTWLHRVCAEPLTVRSLQQIHYSKYYLICQWFFVFLFAPFIFQNIFIVKLLLEKI